MENEKDTRIQDVEAAFDTAIEEYTTRVALLLNDAPEVIAKRIAIQFVMAGMLNSDAEDSAKMLKVLRSKIFEPDVTTAYNAYVEKQQSCTCPSCTVRRKIEEATGTSVFSVDLADLPDALQDMIASVFDDLIDRE